MNKTICMIGGDERNSILAELLKKEYIVKNYGEKDIKELLKNSDCVVSGIPFSRDNETINMGSSLEKVTIENFFNNMKDVKKLIAGSFSDRIKSLAVRYDIELYDFLDDEDFAVYNAIPTAEGAIAIAIEKTKRTINDSNCVVLGYGRIGKCVADLLKGLHANVTVVARKDEDFAWIKAMGYTGKKYSDLEAILPSTDILFNTVPALVIQEELNYMRKDSLIIDLASKPGGIDFELAKAKGIEAELALGLPGKVAPKSVAEYMFNKVKKVI
jgi:dipicolinate synthase subunit A